MGNSKKIKIPTKSAVKGTDIKWVIVTVICTFITAAMFSMFSSSTLGRVHIVLAFLILALFITIGILFDIIGMAVTSANEAPFHSMASHGVKCAPKAIAIIRNAEKVSNFCNDVIGDICGIVSGSVAGIIVIRLALSGSILWSALITSVVSAITVGGKAVGKGIAISRSNQIVYYVALIASWFSVKKK